jgi:monovalent cation:H+ antiporter-2, CPA2 family
MHDHAFLLNLAEAIAAGLAGGLLARLLRLPVIVGYLVAGVVIGPYTPGIFADVKTVSPVANLGVVLLMFAVGVQFSLHELNAVRRTALVGGGVQIVGTVLLGLLLGVSFGWGPYAGLFLGCAISLSSTAVMMRILEERGEIGTGHGAVMLGIGVVQDLTLVLMVALLPALAEIGKEGGAAVGQVGLALLRAGGFIAATLLLATRVVPALLDYVARLGSRELFLLAVVVICMSAAVAAEVAGLGLALGAFLAGLVISESDYAHEVFSQVRPLRDVFACLFFVSVGMLLDPAFLAQNWEVVLAVVAAIILGKALLIILPVYLLGSHGRTAILAALGLAQIGEFSFVLATMGTTNGLIDPQVANVILSSALVTILLAPFLFQAAGPLYDRLNRIPSLSRVLNREAMGQIVGSDSTEEAARVIVIGYGRVGRYVSDALRTKAVPHLVVEYDADAVRRAREAGMPVVYGDASSSTVLEQARPRESQLAVIALPDAALTEMAVRGLKRIAPTLPVVARVHRGIHIPSLRRAGADAVIHAEFEAGTEMIRQGLDRLGFPDEEVDRYIEEVRQHKYREE